MQDSQKGISSFVLAKSKLAEPHRDARAPAAGGWAWETLSKSLSKAEDVVLYELTFIGLEQSRPRRKSRQEKQGFCP